MNPCETELKILIKAIIQVINERMLSQKLWKWKLKKWSIYNDKLDKLKKTSESEMQNKNDHFLKIKPVVTTGDKEKLQRETKEQSNWDSENKYKYYQEGSPFSMTGGNTTTGNKDN